MIVDRPPRQCWQDVCFSACRSPGPTLKGARHAKHASFQFNFAEGGSPTEPYSCSCCSCALVNEQQSPGRGAVGATVTRTITRRVIVGTTITRTITRTRTLNIAQGVCQDRKTTSGSRVLGDIQKLMNINLVSMITTITRGRFSVPRRSGCKYWVIVRVIARNHEQ